jgi:Polysaccharide biosynthesis/export protein
MNKPFIILASAFALAGGALGQSPAPAPADVSRPAVSASPTSSSSAIGPINAVSAPTGYILSPNDQVGVEVFGEDDLRTLGRLNAEGNLSVPLIGSVHLAGLTLGQASTKLTDLFGRDYLVNPRVNVMLIGYAKRRFTMLGQVNAGGQPGRDRSSGGDCDGGRLHANRCAGTHQCPSGKPTIAGQREAARAGRPRKLHCAAWRHGNSRGKPFLKFPAKYRKTSRLNRLLHIS